MAADEVMLAGAIGGTASLRFYGWSPATLSLGYFQPAASRLADPRLAALPYVRRATGGHALVHDRELTYSLALPAGEPWQDSRPWSTRMHEIIRDAFRTLGVELQLAGSERDPSTILCFRQYTPGDLLCRGAKVVGSAQRRSHGALLQHGGILLAQSAYTPSLPGVAETTGISVIADEVRIGIVREFAQATSWSIADHGWSPTDSHHIGDLVRRKYTHPNWNDRR
jgi:lipoate-protein ligase A